MGKDENTGVTTSVGVSSCASIGMVLAGLLAMATGGVIHGLALTALKIWLGWWYVIYRLLIGLPAGWHF